MTFKDTPTWALQRTFTVGGQRRQPGVHLHLHRHPDDNDNEPLDTNLLLPHRGVGDPLYIGDVYSELPTQAEKEWSEGLPKYVLLFLRWKQRD